MCSCIKPQNLEERVSISLVFSFVFIIVFLKYSDVAYGEGGHNESDYDKDYYGNGYDESENYHDDDHDYDYCFEDDNEKDDYNNDNNYNDMLISLTI